jgi:hypothetical protein
VIGTWSPIHLRTKLKEIYWKAEKPAVKAVDFWEDTLKYLYLPRLKDRGVLSQAIIKGAGTRDFFGTAYGQSGELYEGFKFGDGNVQLDDTLLLIEADAAKAYEVAHPPVPATTPTTAVATAPTAATTVTPASTSATTPSVAPTPKAKSFHGSVEVSPTLAKVQLLKIADEIISLLAADPNADVKVRLEISADFPAGAPDHVKRGVSENSGHLKFRNADWE